MVRRDAHPGPATPTSGEADERDAADSRWAAAAVAADFVESPVSRPLGPQGRRLWAVLWPAFLTAGLLEMLVFALVDPQDLRGWGGAPLEASRPAVYTLAFLVFWAVIALAGSLTALLLREPPADPAP